MGAKGGKTESDVTSMQKKCLVSSEQGVNAGLSLHTGVMSQGQTDAVKEGIQETFPL